MSKYEAERLAKMSKLEQAIRLATEYHAGQLDKQGKPYILHCLRIMLEFENQEDMIVAVLHDILEDTECPYERILTLFGTRICDRVNMLTRPKGQTYVEYIEDIATSDLDVAKIKLVDIHDNMMRLPTMPNKEHAESLFQRYIKAHSRLMETM